jgi:signal transduction histidine kinase
MARTKTLVSSSAMSRHRGHGVERGSRALKVRKPRSATARAREIRPGIPTRSALRAAPTERVPPPLLVDDEEAAINATVLELHNLLHHPLPEPDLLREVNRFAAKALGCDFSSTYLWDPERDVGTLVGNVGARDEVQEELPQIEFPRGSMPLVDALLNGQVIEIEDAERQSFVPVVLLRSLQVASILCVPFGGMDGIGGGFVHGFRSRIGPFSSRQRRLAVRIAQVSAKALDNARLIESYRRASELKSAFLATLSHELRTPVHVILGMTECLQGEGLDGLAGEFVATIDRQSRVLASMIDDLLDLSAIEANRIELAADPFDPRTVVESAVASWRDKAVAKGLELSCSVNRRVPHGVIGDPRRLEQILVNLISNAIKFTETGGVDVVVQEVSDEAREVKLRFAVRDTGIGIAPEDQKLLFEAFSRVHLETHRHYGGTGLGLAICKRLTALFEGEIGVDSEAGRGSTFWFTVRLGRRGRQRLLAERPGSSAKRAAPRDASRHSRATPEARSPAR